jgi:hypothetical protein
LQKKDSGKGFFVIAPHVSENPSAAQLARWDASEPKRYKVRMVYRKNPAIEKEVLPE